MVGVIYVTMVALLGATVLCVPEGRLRDGYGNEHGRQPSYGVESEERDASVDDHPPCAPRDASGSAEHGYNFDGHPSQEPLGGFSVRAAAAASSSTYS